VIFALFIGNTWIFESERNFRTPQTLSKGVQSSTFARTWKIEDSCLKSLSLSAAISAKMNVLSEMIWIAVRIFCFLIKNFPISNNYYLWSPFTQIGVLYSPYCWKFNFKVFAITNFEFWKTFILQLCYLSKFGERKQNEGKRGREKREKCSFKNIYINI
jgi:hypothetical protein